MKKTYVKPGLYVEQFSLSQSVAGGCGAAHNSTIGGPLQWSKTTCAWGVPGGNLAIWTNENQSCTKKWGPDDDFNGICYNNPSGGNNIFNS